MTPPPPQRLVVELEHDGRGIAGRVLGPSGSSLPFEGWVGLAAAIDRVALGVAPQKTGVPSS